MNRPAGVIVTAVLLFLAAAFFVAYMAIFYFSIRLLQAQQGASQMQLPGFMFYAVQGFYFLLAVWAAVTGIGLLKLGNWARISLLVIACTAVMVAAMGALVFWFLPMPEVQGADPQSWQMIRIVTAVVFAVPGIVGVWWLTYFTRPRIKENFAGAVLTASGPTRPFTMTLLGWLLVTSAPFSVLAVPLGWPTWFMGLTLRGWSAAAIYVFWAVAGTAAGYGLLKLKPWAYTLTIVFYLVGIVNSLAIYLLPGAFERMVADSHQLFRLPPPKSPPPQLPMWVYILLTLAFSGVLFYFLLTRRKRFLEAAAARAASR